MGLNLKSTLWSFRPLVVLMCWSSAVLYILSENTDACMWSDTQSLCFSYRYLTSGSNAQRNSTATAKAEKTKKVDNKNGPKLAGLKLWIKTVFAKEKAFNIFVRSQGYPQCFLVRNTERETHILLIDSTGHLWYPLHLKLMQQYPVTDSRGPSLLKMLHSHIPCYFKITLLG